MSADSPKIPANEQTATRPTDQVTTADKSAAARVEPGRTGNERGRVSSDIEVRNPPKGDGSADRADKPGGWAERVQAERTDKSGGEVERVQAEPTDRSGVQGDRVQAERGSSQTELQPDVGQSGRAEHRTFMEQTERPKAWPDGQYAYHYGHSSNQESIMRNGLREGTFATDTGDLSKAQTAIELGTPPNKPIDTVYTIDIGQMQADGCSPPSEPRQVPSGMERSGDEPLKPGYQNRAGGGYEVKFDEPIPAKYLVEAKRVEQ